MTFLNQALAMGAAAFAIPLIIHVLNRSRFKTVEWGAMHLLESVIKVNHRRFRLDQLILLLVRCAIPVLLALCLARPVLTGVDMLQGDAPLSLVVVLDTSYSMDAVAASGTRFDQAVDAACRLVESAGRGSQIAVIQSGGRPTPLFDQPVVDADAVIRRLRQLSASQGASDMQTSLQEGLDLLNRMSHARRELVVISDFQSGDWQSLNGAAGDTLRETMAALPLRPALTLLSVGAPVTQNISVDSLHVPQQAIGIGQQLTVRSTIRNHGNEARDAMRAILTVDGNEESVTHVSLPPNGTAQVLFTCRVEAPGSHVLEVHVVADDGLPTDNRFSAAITVWDSVPVLLVDGDPAGQPLKGETDFLSIALTPFTFGRVQLEDLIQTRTIRTQQLDEAALHAARVVVLANVDRLNDEQVARVSTFIQNGGALLICAGSRIDANWYRDRLFADGQGLLPLPFQKLRDAAELSGASSSPPEPAVSSTVHIALRHFDHPCLEMFNDPANGDLSTASIRRWYAMTSTAGVPETGSETGSETGASGTEKPVSDERPVEVLLQLSTGEPLLVERRFGDGVVMQLATTIDADWSDLPMRPFYVPLMQQMITTLASRLAPPRNIQTGEPAVVLYTEQTLNNDGSVSGDPPLDASAELASGASQSGHHSVSVVTPNGSRQTIQATPVGTRRMARFESTQQPGVYHLTLPSAETLHFVAQTSRSESDLQTLDDTDLQRLAEHLQATHITSPEQYLQADHLRRHGREIWIYLLAAWLFLMFAELVLQQRFARVRA